MFLIMSAAYIEQELQAEFGKIPPAFLPLGNKRLYERQIELAKEKYSVAISIPLSYKISAIDEKYFCENEVSVIRIPDNLSLGQSLITAINMSNIDFESSLDILFGDTLLSSLPDGENIITTATALGEYNWKNIDEIKPLEKNGLYNKRVISGFFRFQYPRQLLRSLSLKHADFFEGITDYKDSISVSLVHTNDWLDFGHVNTYFQSKAQFTTEKSFNELKINKRYIEKSSIKKLKIQAESNWFDNIPSEMRIYTPAYLGASKFDGNFSYKLEYLYLSALNELYVYGELSISVWDDVISKCIEFIKDCLKYRPTVHQSKNINQLNELLKLKTLERIEKYRQESNFDLDKKRYFNGLEAISVAEIINSIDKYLPEDNGEWIGLLHGDFCFSNILYDFRGKSIRVINPRGINTNNEFTIFGDVRYDIAKLSHSIIGLYDLLISEFYHLDYDEDEIKFSLELNTEMNGLQKLFLDAVETEFDLSFKTLLSMQIHLFLSMLPLHSDCKKRQQAILANVYRLYHKID
ncbi:capsular biosynthesis protein [Pseudoalteromonas gelatinilytica]